MRAKQTEADFTRQVIQFARLHRWRVAHFRPGMDRRGKWKTAVQGDGAGFPDLILARGRRVVALELKVGKNRPTPEQAAWIAAFQEAGIPAMVLRPENWAKIEEVLGIEQGKG